MKPWDLLRVRYTTLEALIYVASNASGWLETMASLWRPASPTSMGAYTRIVQKRPRRYVGFMCTTAHTLEHLPPYSRTAFLMPMTTKLQQCWNPNN